MYIKELEKFAVEPYFYIGEDDWTKVKETYERADVQETLAEILMKYDLPYMEISEKEALAEYKTLKGTKWNDLFVDKKWFARSEYKWPLSTTLLKRLNTGNKASNFFQQENRWSVCGSVSPGPLRTWKNKDFMTSLMGCLYTLKSPKVDKSTLRTGIGLRKYICSQFKPNVAKVLYEKHNAKTVLDFSMGWGDRLCGFFASDCTEKYIGLDPRKENHPIYKQQAEFYEKHRTFFEVDKSYDFICSPAEDADLSAYKESVDLIMTSPPYFSVERYSNDDTQSWVRHKSIEDWNTQFLQKAIDNVWETLKPGGLLMVNISDVNTTSKGMKGGKQWLKICDPMNEHLNKKNNASYVECFGMEMAKRPNCLGIGTAEDTDDSKMDTEYHAREGSFGEPVWVWQKN